MTPQPTAADIEDQLTAILKQNRPGTQIRGCMGHLEVLSRLVQKEILEPLLKARGDAGLVSPLNDLGHDTSFASSWNRAITGESQDWDCRVLSETFVSAAIADTPRLAEKFNAGDFDDIENALLKNLPTFLTSGMPPATSRSLMSWVDGSYVRVRVDGMQPVLEDPKGGDLTTARPLAAYKDAGIDEDGTPIAFFGLMAFHADGIDDDESTKAWEAWRTAADNAQLLHRGYYDTMLGLSGRSYLSMKEFGISWQQLRQDESVSVEEGPEGVTIYRGAVKGMKQISDEGQFMAGPRSSFMKLLMEGGFSKAGAGSYLDRLAQSSSAFATTLPAGCNMRVMLDPETLYAFDMDDDDMIYDIDKSEAIPILAAGTFEMPEMISHRERKLNTPTKEDTPCL